MNISSADSELHYLVAVGDSARAQRLSASHSHFAHKDINRMSYVLVIEPHQGQAGMLQHVGRQARTALTIVDSVGAALRAIDAEVPQLVLASALMPPQEEGELLARLRDLPLGTAPQILITPALALPDSPRPKRERFRILRARERDLQPAICDPSAFADQLSVYLDHADRLRYETWRPPTPGRVSKRAKKDVDRRAALRFERVDWTRALVDGTAVDLVDLSLTGAQILAPRILEPGSSVQILLSSEAHQIHCEAGVVWGTSGIVGPAQTRWCRAGMTFKDVDREAFERLYFRRN